MERHKISRISKISCYMLCIAVLIFGTAPYLYAEASKISENVFDFPEISASSAVLMEADSGTVLYEKDMRKKLPMASITKIMTAVTVLEECDEDEEVSVPYIAVGTEGSSVYLKAGEKFTVKELLFALMLESANDAAVALAVHICGNTEDFASLMNEKAKELKMTDTHFSNPHGLPDDEHYTTAYDFAVLTAYALKNKSFSEIVSSYNYSCRGRAFVNHNKLLKTYKGCIGVKTGFTKKSGRCLVSAAERDGLTLVAVTLNAPSDWSDHRAMLDYGFSAYERITVADRGELSFAVPVVNGTEHAVTCSNKDKLSAFLDSGGHDVRCRINLKPFYYADIKKGDILGSAELTVDGKTVKEIPLYADYTVCSVKYYGFFGKLIQTVKRFKINR